jgi:hypothetical protein
MLFSNTTIHTSATPPQLTISNWIGKTIVLTNDGEQMCGELGYGNSDSDVLRSTFNIGGVFMRITMKQVDTFVTQFTVDARVEDVEKEEKNFVCASFIHSY